MGRAERKSKRLKEGRPGCACAALKRAPRFVARAHSFGWRQKKTVKAAQENDVKKQACEAASACKIPCEGGLGAAPQRRRARPAAARGKTQSHEEEGSKTVPIRLAGGRQTRRAEAGNERFHARQEGHAPRLRLFFRHSSPFVKPKERSSLSVLCVKQRLPIPKRHKPALFSAALSNK